MCPASVSRFHQGRSFRALACTHFSLVGRYRGDPGGREHAQMADLAFAVLLIVGFGLLALTLRGLEKL